jgi:uncharacterized membrane protein (DUF4010 family)
VILPAVPNRSFTAYEVNPFTICLVVVAVSGISYLSYLLQRFWRREGGLFLAGVLGGAYSSTATTVALARSARQATQPSAAYTGAIVAATGMMYLRLWVLVALFAPELARELSAVFWPLGLAAIGVGLLVGRRRAGDAPPAEAAAAGDRRRATANPLELSSALTFAGLFVVVLVLTRIIAGRFGGTGLVVMAAIMGTTDVDPFILGLTQQTAAAPPVAVAALAVVVAAANNLMKGLRLRRRAAQRRHAVAADPRLPRRRQPPLLRGLGVRTALAFRCAWLTELLSDGHCGRILRMQRILRSVWAEANNKTTSEVHQGCIYTPRRARPAAGVRAAAAPRDLPVAAAVAVA